MGELISIGWRYAVISRDGTRVLKKMTGVAEGRPVIEEAAEGVHRLGGGIAHPTKARAATAQ